MRLKYWSLGSYCFRLEYFILCFKQIVLSTNNEIDIFFLFFSLYTLVRDQKIHGKRYNGFSHFAVIQIKIREIRNLGCERKKKWEIKKRNQRKERKKRREVAKAEKSWKEETR